MSATRLARRLLDRQRVRRQTVVRLSAADAFERAEAARRARRQQHREQQLGEMTWRREGWAP